MAVVVGVLWGWPWLMGQTKGASRSAAQGPFTRAVDRTFQEGVPAKLPPHLSTLLGLTKEQECSVKQNAERSGTTVKGIDVSTANKNDVVLFVVNEATRDQTLYLTSSSGRLRRLVAVKAGEGAVYPITDADRQAFQKEKQFWVERLSGATKK